MKHVFCPLPIIAFFLLWLLSLLLCCRGDRILILLSLLSGYCSLLVSLSLDMAPTNKKRALSVPSCLDSTKRADVARAPKRPASKLPMKKPAAKKLSSLGFLSTRHQSYQTGTKILLTNGIYDEDEVLEKVKGHLCLYEIVEWSENGKMAKIEYKNQVIRAGGDRFRTY
jgi:hypothetical protein